MRNWFYYVFISLVMCSCGGGRMVRDVISKFSSNYDANYTLKWVNEYEQGNISHNDLYVLIVEDDGSCYYTLAEERKWSSGERDGDTYTYRGTWELRDCIRGAGKKKFVKCDIREFSDEGRWHALLPEQGWSICIDPSKEYVWNGQTSDDCIEDCIHNRKQTAFKTEIMTW